MSSKERGVGKREPTAPNRRFLLPFRIPGLSMEPLTDAKLGRPKESRLAIPTYGMARRSV